VGTKGEVSPSPGRESKRPPSGLDSVSRIAGDSDDDDHEQADHERRGHDPDIDPGHDAGRRDQAAAAHAAFARLDLLGGHRGEDERDNCGDNRTYRPANDRQNQGDDGIAGRRYSRHDC